MATKTKIAAAAGFDAAVPLTKIHPHPKNPRRNATASDELVESVKAQGLMQALVLAPHADIAGEYVLIAGHRRRDALTRAGVKTAKAEIRADLVTEVQQIEAMLTENSARQDLTAIEEAEAYEQLQLFNLKPADIARATGRSRQTVSSRLKLLTLGEAGRTKVHDGQVTIDDALALVDLPKAAREDLEPLLGTGEFRWKLGLQRDRIQRVEKYKADLKVAAELDIPAYSDSPVDPWDLQREGLILQLHHVRTDNGSLTQAKAEHADCLRWLQVVASTGVSTMTFACADPDSHVDENAGPSTDTDAEREAREAHTAKINAQLDAEREGNRVAARLRFETMTAASPAAVFRCGLPLYLWSLDTVELGEFNEVLDLEPNGLLYQLDAPYWTALTEALAKASDQTVLRAMLALFAGELRIRAEDKEPNPLVAQFLDGLVNLGHELSEVDAAQLAAALDADEAGEVA